MEREYEKLKEESEHTKDRYDEMSESLA